MYRAKAPFKLQQDKINGTALELLSATLWAQADIDAGLLT